MNTAGTSGRSGSCLAQGWSWTLSLPSKDSVCGRWWERTLETPWEKPESYEWRVSRCNGSKEKGMTISGVGLMGETGRASRRSWQLCFDLGGQVGPRGKEGRYPRQWERLVQRCDGMKCSTDGRTNQANSPCLFKSTSLGKLDWAGWVGPLSEETLPH